MRCVLLVHAEHLAALQALDFQLTLLDELYNGEEVSYIRNVILIGRYNYIMSFRLLLCVGCLLMYITLLCMAYVWIEIWLYIYILTHCS